MNILALDPGTTQTGFVVFVDGRVTQAGVLDNDEMLGKIGLEDADLLACEMIASYGMPVGREVFETCVWIGRFIQQWEMSSDVSSTIGGRPHKLIYRKDVKLHLTGSVRAKDGNIRQALIDKLGPQGTKKAPGPTYGVKSHAWPALAVAVYANDMESKNAE